MSWRGSARSAHHGFSTPLALGTLATVASDGEPLLVLRATVRRSAEKIFAREVSETSRRLRSEGERRLGRRRLQRGVRWEEDRTETDGGMLVTVRAYPA